MARTVKGYKGVGMNGAIARWYATSTAKERGLALQVDMYR